MNDWRHINRIPDVPSASNSYAIPRAYDREHSNPVPGQFHPALHGSLVSFKLLNFCRALKTHDQSVAAQAGTELLKAVHEEGGSEDFRLSMQGAVQDAVHALVVQQPGPGGACGTGTTDPSENIDLYQPDPNRFYALDQRSGAELAEVLEDLHFTERYLRRGARAPTRLLFIGGPGTGKTTGGLWLGSQLGVPVALVRIDATVQSSVGGTAKQIRASFEFARDNGAMLLIDEFEAVAVPRNNQSGNVGQWSRETTSALLQLLDALPQEQIVVGATNHVEIIDSAVQRRMRKHVYFWPPDRDTRAHMVQQWWARCPHEGEAKRELLDLTEGRSGDVLERIAEEANRAAARRREDAKVTAEDVQLAAARVLAADVAEESRKAQAQPPT